MNSRTLTQYAGAIAIVAILAGITYLIMIIATAPDPYIEPSENAGGQICIGIDYDELFPVGHEYGKDGEIITMDPLPDPAATPDSHSDHPVMPWIDQSLSGQSPPVLFWPAPAYKQTIRKPAKPCADRYKPVTEPGLLALVGAALLAMGAIKWKK